MIGKERGLRALDERFETLEMLAIEPIGRAEVHAHAVLNDFVLLEDLVEDLERTAAVAHVVFGNDLEPVDLGFLAENMLVVRHAKANADSQICVVVKAICGHSLSLGASVHRTVTHDGLFRI